jgi:hypothetical protein
VKSELLETLTAGSYVKVMNRSRNVSVEKISKVTKTQLVIVVPSAWGEPSVYRYNIGDGTERGRDWYYRRHITSQSVTPEEIDAYEKMAKQCEERRLKKAAIDAKRDALQAEIRTVFSRVPAEKLKLDYSSPDGLETVAWSLEIKGVSDEELCANGVTR